MRLVVMNTIYYRKGEINRAANQRDLLGGVSEAQIDAVNNYFKSGVAENCFVVVEYDA
jgi:hypothetical protein